MIFDFENTATLKSGSEVTRGSSKLLPFVSLPVVSYELLLVTLSLKCTVFEIFCFEKYRDGLSLATDHSMFESIHRTVL